MLHLERGVEMKKKVVTGIMLTLLLIGMLTFAFDVQPAKASGTIYIRRDGSVDPSSAPISREGDIYTFTDDIYDYSIVIEKDNIVVDGAGHIILGLGYGKGIDLSHRSNVKIKTMLISGFTYGIFLYGSSRNIIQGTHIANNQIGILLESSSRNTLAGNGVITNSDCGIMLYNNSSNNTLTGNIIANEYLGYWGIYIFGSHRNFLSGNNVTTNNGQGILLSESSNNTLTGNNISGNSVGIDLQYSSHNLIYHNNFVNDPLQVSTFDSWNVWDNGYPSGGNYWRDYYGYDVYRGPYQNITGSDGIGDTPYIIDESNQDNYPLMEPWTLVPSTRYPWPMFHHNLRHTGYTESPAPRTNQIQWTYTTGSEVRSSPAVADGIVFIGSNDSNVYALDQYSGALVWSFTTGGWVQSSPAIADGKVYVGSFDGKVYCLDASTGAPIWNYTTSGIVFSSPAVSGGNVYLGSLDHKVYCLDSSTGAPIWNYITEDWITSSPAVVDGKVYVGSLDHKVYCLDAFTGAHIWSYATGDDVDSSPAIFDGKVYVGSDDSKVYCLDSFTGARIWSYTTGSKVHSSPAVGDGRVYIGSDDNKVYCLDAFTGAHIWNCTTGGEVQSSPAIADGKVYVGSFDGKVYCLDAFTGDSIWSYTTGSKVHSSPAVADGMIFIGSGDHAVYAFGNVIRVPEDFPTVQDAIDAAPSEATISIATGVYHEYVIVNKPLTILGREGSTPKYEGGGSGTAFTLSSNASGTTLSGIIITNYAQAIFIDGASNCKIYNNIMTANVNSGIAEGNNANNNLIYSNVFQENPGVAINLTQYSTSTTIYNNTIILNNIGLNLNSSGNTIYWNIFIDNTIQVQVKASLSNTWDNGYPDGGNYWSGYTGVDLKCGSGQDLPGSDGIGDTQYTIDVPNNIIDRYPLMKPFSPHDLGIVSVIPSRTVVAQGFTLRIDLKILNYGIYNELFTVTVYAKTTSIATQTNTLTRRNSTTITFTWNTAGVVKGNYTISAEADLVLGEVDTADNTYIDGRIFIAKVGDLGSAGGFFKCDGSVDGFDLALFIQCYNDLAPQNAMYLGDLGSAGGFFACDEKVDGFDLALFIQCYNELGPDP